MPSVMRRMNVVSRCQAIYRSRALESEDILSCHHAFVLAICHNPGMSQDAIAKRICLNKSTVTRALSYLEERGYVRREPKAEDKRVLLIYPTEKMLNVLPRVEKITRDWNREISEEIPDEEMKTFLLVLEKLEARAREAVFGRDVGATEK